MGGVGERIRLGLRRLLARRLARVLLLVAVALVVARMVLPAVLRRVVVSQADEAMVGRIEIDDVDLSLVRGAFTLHGLRVYSAEAVASDASPSASGAVAPTPAAAATGHPTVVPTDATVVATDATPTADAEPTPIATSSPAAAVTTSAPSPGTTSGPPTEAGTGPPGSAPLLSARRLMVNLAWRPLFRRLVEIERIELEGAAVGLDRAQDGALVLPAAAPSTEPTPEQPPSDDAGWGVLIRSVAIHAGRIGFRDFAVGDPPQRLDVDLPAVEASELALLITQSGLQPGKLALDAGIQDGTLHLDATIESLPAGPAYESHLVLTNVPIADSRVYIPKVGWSGLAGRLDADLVHRFESEGAHTVRGTAALRELDVRVASLGDPALAWRRLAVEVGGIDFVAQHADVTAVALEGARVVTRPAGPAPLPVLEGLMRAAAETVDEAVDPPPSPAVVATSAAVATAVATPAASPSEVASPDGAMSPAGASPGAAASPAAAAPPSASVTSAGGKPWTWAVGKLRVADGHVQVVGGDAPLGVDVQAEAAPLTSEAGKAAAIRLTLTPASGGTLDVAGNLVPDPLAFDGTLTVKDLALAPLTQPVASTATRLLKNGVANLDLAIAAGGAGNAPPGGVRVAGTIGLSDLDVTGDDPGAFALRWKSLAVGLRSATVPGVLGADAATAPGPIDVAFDAVTLTEPDFTLTRTADGIVLPPGLGGSDAAAAPATGAAPATADTTPKPAPSPTRGPAAIASPAATAPAGGTPSEQQSTTDVRVHADRVAIDRMLLTTHDTTVQPFFHSTLHPVNLTATAVDWPGPAAQDVKLVATSADGGVLTVTGTVAPARTKLSAKLADLALAPFNPYAASTGYGVTGGTARLESTITITKGAYDTRSRLVLNRLGVTSAEGDALFTSTFGMPLELALSLLTDLQGNIVLDLPIAGDEAGMRTGVGTIIGNALTRAILNAVTSPLKLIGAVTRIGEKPAAVTPGPVAFLAGRAVMADGEPAKLDSLASLLGRAPGLRLHLRGEAGDADRRWLREQALRAKLEAESGVFGSVRHVAERGARKAALAALTARAEGQAGEIPAEHREWFETKVGEQQVDDAALRTLAEARAAEVQKKLASGQGIDAPRLVLDEPRLDAAARPVVAIGLGAPAPAVAASAAPSPSPAPTASPGSRRGRPARDR
jgi:hypothetical protein